MPKGQRAKVPGASIHKLEVQCSIPRGICQKLVEREEEELDTISEWVKAVMLLDISLNYMTNMLSSLLTKPLKEMFLLVNQIT